MFNFLYSIFAFLFRILYGFIGNYGLALVIFTLFFRVILLPTTIKQQKSAAKQYRLQPKLKRIREKYQDYAPAERNQKIQEETSALYQREGYGAMTAGCLPMLLQLPILWGLYGIVRQPLTYVLKIPTELVTVLSNAAAVSAISDSNKAYIESALIAHIDEFKYKIPQTASHFAAELQKISEFNFTAFGIDLGAVPAFSTIKNFGSATAQERALLLIPLLSFVTSMMTSVLSQVRQKKSNPNMENTQMMGCMMLMMPLMSLWFTFQFPAGMGMYWILANLFGFAQTLILGHIYTPGKIVARMMVDETIQRRSYENNLKFKNSMNAD